MEFTWKVESVDEAAKTMVVEYTHSSQTHRLNIPIPGDEENLSSWIKTFAPIREWERAAKRFATVQAGATGTETIVPAAPQALPQRTVWDEASLRTLISQVLSEREAGGSSS